MIWLSPLRPFSSLAYEKIEAAEVTKKAVLANAQNEADTLLDAEVRLGELLAEIKPKYDMGSSKRTNVKMTPRRTKTLPPAITKKDSHLLAGLFPV